MTEPIPPGPKSGKPVFCFILLSSPEYRIYPEASAGFSQQKTLSLFRVFRQMRTWRKIALNIPMIFTPCSSVLPWWKMICKRVVLTMMGMKAMSTGPANRNHSAYCLSQFQSLLGSNFDYVSLSVDQNRFKKAKVGSSSFQGRRMTWK